MSGTLRKQPKVADFEFFFPFPLHPFVSTDHFEIFSFIFPLFMKMELERYECCQVLNAEMTNEMQDEKVLIMVQEIVRWMRIR
jgi:hypothetical protein